MIYSFRVKQVKYSKTKGLLFSISQLLFRLRVASEQEYNKLLKSIIGVVKTYEILKKTPLFDTQIAYIDQSKPLTEKTVWGGISLKKIDTAKDLIQKLLVIRQFGILGFEIHKKKLEKLKVLEGECLFFYSNHITPEWEQGEVTIRYARRGDRLVLLPGDEHGIIALSNCVIEEISTNHLDDLVYIFRSKQVIAKDYCVPSSQEDR